jgi:diguanylate cyclase (GGDEF)-like protein
MLTPELTAMSVGDEATTRGHTPRAEFDLRICDQEPIHIPGAIQPHGAMLAARIGDLLVTHASANLAAILGVSAEDALGRPLAQMLGEAACTALRGECEQNEHRLDYSDILVTPEGSTLHLQVHRVAELVIIDIEPALKARQGFPAIVAQSVLETFKQATTRLELCEAAVQRLKVLTGFDRVLAYRFSEDGHGAVIAEAREDSLEPFLGHHYPASDIPQQARRQYLLQRVGAVADSSYQAVPLLSHPTLHDGTPLDMTHSSLRAISPVHLKYMRNMNTAASLTIGLAHEQTLWGMLVCHHSTPRPSGPELRAAVDIVGQVVSLMLGSLGQMEVYTQRFERSVTMRKLIDKLATSASLMDAFATAEQELLKLVAADGAMVRLSGKILYFGRTPPASAAQSALSVLHRAAAGEVLAVEDLGLRYPELVSCAAEGSGALMLPLSKTDDDAILWFRPELSRDVIWGGNPDKSARLDPVSGRLSPRKSFAAWTVIVRGHSLPWQDVDLSVVRELRGAIEAEIVQRTKAELAKLRNYDVLTGLPNRRLVQIRLAESKEHAERGSAALLFLDLDRFKEVNDTLGHAAGDSLLIQVAQRISMAAGPENLVARLGGDEFVVLCHGLEKDALAGLGERMRLAIERPFEIAGRPCHISVSLGIARANEMGELDLLRAADMAMYAAKKGGGNRGMVFEQSLYESVARQFELEHDLRNALARDDQLSLVYQPIYDVLPGNQVVGFEARLRWQHPQEGWLAPKLIIPMAEKSGLILPLGAWILKEALRQGRCFQQLLPEQALRLSVNISPFQIKQGDFCTALASMLQESDNFSPSSLCLEVTEALLADVVAADVIADLRKLGVKIALDDFGMGSSSLSNLRAVPVDIVKLDRSFLDQGQVDEHVSSFIGAMINLAHAAGLSVTAKGIETSSQLAAVTDAGVDNVQGFLLAPPLSATAAAELLTPPRSI